MSKVYIVIRHEIVYYEGEYDDIVAIFKLKETAQAKADILNYEEEDRRVHYLVQEHEVNE